MGGSACRAVVDTPAESECLVIIGLTRSGKPFRPSDWAQRLATAAGCRQRDGRFRFHPQVRIAMVDGTTAVVVEESLATIDPPLYRFLQQFGIENELQLSRR